MAYIENLIESNLFLFELERKRTLLLVLLFVVLFSVSSKLVLLLV